MSYPKPKLKSLPKVHGAVFRQQKPRFGSLVSQFGLEPRRQEAAVGAFRVYGLGFLALRYMCCVFFWCKVSGLGLIYGRGCGV